MNKNASHFDILSALIYILINYKLSLFFWSNTIIALYEMFISSRQGEKLIKTNAFNIKERQNFLQSVSLRSLFA